MLKNGQVLHHSCLKCFFFRTNLNDLKAKALPLPANEIPLLYNNPFPSYRICDVFEKQGEKTNFQALYPKKFRSASQGLHTTVSANFTESQNPLISSQKWIEPHSDVFFVLKFLSKLPKFWNQCFYYKYSLSGLPWHKEILTNIKSNMAAPKQTFRNIEQVC